MVMSQSISVGDLASFLLYTAYVGGSLGGLTSFYSEVMKGIGAGSRLFELLDRPSAIPLDSGEILKDARGRIQFHNVDFAYPTRPKTAIFKDMNLIIDPGTVVAVVGQSGSGKSTVGSLLLRFYDPIRGTITINDTDIKKLNLHWWRRQIGLVSQEPVLFAGTIAENIAYGANDDTEVSLEDVQNAARKANCENFILSFPDGYDTFVGERGISLSGGQKQRIAIARALLKDPTILILDEATSALDAESEALVQDALETLMRGRTVFTIAHRMSTIRSADVIACLDQGRVAEMGTYEELMKKEEGVFKKLMEHQRVEAEWMEDEELTEHRDREPQEQEDRPFFKGYGI
ncbi:hypothetical protein BZG36_04638 [Bifiguratus adelaidae]|uniref:ABC transporter domain-containing protein n=1 Tax=Bifiguratus adelaidae TaxID=1938954 RepID=A0A261XUV2_9FUNG|nr:hypothetical protein BZG36_04638 [Bifiguratus adelaidae]